jgi:two-component system sensor histidine kinase YesM
MVENLKNLVDQVYKQKIMVQRSEMKQLQSQINPHFLYNSFFILNTMSRVGDYDNLECFTQQLGEYFQFVTRNAADEVPILKEVNHARVYSEIQAMRYSKRIRVEFNELPESFLKLVVPRLIMQPFIENAFEHGLGMKSAGGILVVRFENIGNEYQIIIEDNGDEITGEKIQELQVMLSNDSEAGEITAIQNIHHRIRLKFGPQSGVSVSRGGLGGLKVTLHIILQQEEKDVQTVNC